MNLTPACRAHQVVVALLIAAGCAFGWSGPSIARAEVNDFEREIVRLLNAERARLGRGSLGTDQRLFDAAEKHSAWMCDAQRLSHVGSGGSTVASRISAEGYRWRALGETIAQGYGSPGGVVSGWRGSAPHWTILMSTSYRDIGVGYVACPGKPRRHLWTVDVANSPDPAQPVGGSGGGGSAPVEPTPTPRPTAAPSGPGAVHGVVRLEGRAEAAGVAILLDGRHVASTNADGRFQLGGLRAGTRVVQARRAGWLDSIVAFRPVPGRTMQLGTTMLRAGDVVVNGRVDYYDFLTWYRSWGRCRPEPPQLDLDGDGCVGYGDYQLLRRNYGWRGPTRWGTR